MKAKKLAFLLLAALLMGVCFYAYFFAGPFRFVDQPLWDESLQHLRSGASSGASWTRSPADAADEYLHWWCDPSDRPERVKLDISVSYRSPDEAVVSVINRYCKDDSVSVMCDRLTLRHERGAWSPLRHQAAWQGRGRFGWTTQPTL
jgi:hypothetical protein